ncbi:unnamed protein product [Calypogeia fissa]
MKCLTNPSMFFRRARPLLPSPPSPALTPQHPKAKLKIVNDIIRKSLSSKGKPSESGRPAFDDNTCSEECVAESFSNITRENEWFLLNVAERLPSARSNHAAVSSGGNVYVIGGESVDGHLSDVQAFNVDRFSWKEIYSGSPDDSEKSGPLTAQGPRLLSPFAAVWKGRLILVGCEESAPNDSPVRVHTFEPINGTWTAQNPKGDIPEARLGYRIVQVQSMLVMFGGEDPSGRIVDDVFVLNLEKMTWTLLQTTGVKPAPRRYHAMACYGAQYIWVYGGKSYATYYNDIYCLDLKQLMWTNVKARGAVPTMPRAGHVGIIRGDSFYLVGGENRGEEMVDTLEFDMRKRSWSVVTSVHAMSPLAHNGLSVLKVRHEGRQYLVAFGGHGILLSCQMYAMLLPVVDQFSEPASLSSAELLRSNSISKRSTLPRGKTSPTDPFQFHHAASSSSLSWESEVAAATAATGPEHKAEESPKSSHKEAGLEHKAEETPKSSRRRGKTMSCHLNIDALTVAQELYQPSRLSNAGREDRSPLLDGLGFEKGFIAIEKSSQIATRLSKDDSIRGLKGSGYKDQPGSRCESPSTVKNQMGDRNDSHTSVKENGSEYDALRKQLRVVRKTIRELEEKQKSMGKDEELTAALVSMKELQEDIIREVRSNKEDQVRITKNTIKVPVDKRQRSPRRRESICSRY